jgi:hypothetical protein
VTGKQNFIFFLGLTIIAINWYFGGQWHVLHDAIFKGPANGGNPNPPSSGGNSSNSSGIGNLVPGAVNPHLPGTSIPFPPGLI